MGSRSSVCCFHKNWFLWVFLVVFFSFGFFNWYFKSPKEVPRGSALLSARVMRLKHPPSAEVNPLGLLGSGGLGLVFLIGLPLVCPQASLCVGSAII